jgi:CDGSH-type Zn-finger protein
MLGQETPSDGEPGMSEPDIPQKAPYGVLLQPGEYWWCSCGKSNNQPFCDGSHQDGPFLPLAFTIHQPGKVWLCGCKRTATPPYCDGSHNKL